nr:hypothetical protein Iba_chr12bCG15450 [Ipomoea batatas]
MVTEQRHSPRRTATIIPSSSLARQSGPAVVNGGLGQQRRLHSLSPSRSSTQASFTDGVAAPRQQASATPVSRKQSDGGARQRSTWRWFPLREVSAAHVDGRNLGRKSRSADAKLAGKIGEYARRSPAFGCCCVAKEIEGRSLSTEESADHPLCVAARNVAQRKRPKPPVSRLSAERRRMAEVLRPSRKEEPDHIAKLMPARRVGVDGVLPTVVARYSLPSPEKKPQPKTIGELLGEVHPCRAGAPPRLFMATAGAPPRL